MYIYSEIVQIQTDRKVNCISARFVCVKDLHLFLTCHLHEAICIAFVHDDFFYHSPILYKILKLFHNNALLSHVCHKLNFKLHSRQNNQFVCQ